MSHSVNVDVAIIGGGIAGLWLLSKLRRQGYGALLIEGARLGQGQTIVSQGLIHGGSGYALAQTEAGVTQAVSDIPPLWRDCLAGSGEVDLSGVRQLARQQYLCTPEPHRGWLSRLFRRIPKPGAQTNPDYTAQFAQLGLAGAMYRLDEPVLEVASLLQTLADAQREAILLNEGSAILSSDSTITLRAEEQEPVLIKPNWCVFTAGIRNATQMWAPLQLRGLHMVMVRGKQLPEDVYVHYLDDSLMSRLTLTSHRAADGGVIWYLGGRLAEQGIRRRTHQQIHEARRELTHLLPKVNLKGAQFATLRVRRVVPRQSDKKRPPEKSSVFQNGKVLVAWPSSLTMAPFTAEAVIKRLQQAGLSPAKVDLGCLTDWPRPAVARYPWDDEQLVLA